jgi:ArsR family transcriptional regulator
MKILLKSLRALADANRLRIIRLLMDGKRCVLEIQAVIKTTQPSVSKQLRILEEAGWVNKKREGRYIDYELAKFDQLEGCQADLLPLISQVLLNSHELTALAQAACHIDRANICSDKQSAG